MTLFEILVISFIMADGAAHCTSVADALLCNGPARERAERLANTVIDALQRHCVTLSASNASLRMGANNLPLDKQFSVRLLKRDVTLNDAMYALDSVCKAEGVTFRELDTDGLFAWYDAIAPFFVKIGRKWSREEILAAYDEYIRQM